MSFEHDKRVILYPSYINSKRTVAEGRRIPLASACENPSVQEMLDCCKHSLKLPADIEGKHYPREWLPLGRLRVQLRQEDGSPVNPDVPTRRILMLKIAELVPKHPLRNKKAAALKADAGSSSSSAGAGSSKQSGKKGKKKK